MVLPITRAQSYGGWDRQVNESRGVGNLLRGFLSAAGRLQRWFDGLESCTPPILRGVHLNGSEEKATRIIAGFLTFSVLQLEKGKHGKTKVKRCGIEPPKA